MLSELLHELIDGRARRTLMTSGRRSSSAEMDGMATAERRPERGSTS